MPTRISMKSPLWYQGGLFFDVQRMFLDCVIGRRGTVNTASSLWPCQKHSLNVKNRVIF